MATGAKGRTFKWNLAVVKAEMNKFNNNIPKEHLQNVTKFQRISILTAPTISVKHRLM